MVEDEGTWRRLHVAREGGGGSLTGDVNEDEFV